MRFIYCGKLETTTGKGLSIPLILTKDKIVRGDLRIKSSLVKNGKIDVSIKEVTGDLICYFLDLVSLEEFPDKVGGGFYCNGNKLTTLKGCPKEIDGAFDCSDNKLTTLEGCPKEIGDYFSCSNNKLESLEGCPKKVGGNFECLYNNKFFTEEEVRAVCNVKGKVYV